MTMPETIWASKAGAWDPLDASELEYQGAHEYVLRSSVQAMIDAAVKESRDYALALEEELRARTAKLERECRLTQAQVDRLLARMVHTHDLREAAMALGAMPEGYCFCSEDRIGDDSKTHEPECSDLRAAIAKIGGAE